LSAAAAPRPGRLYGIADAGLLGAAATADAIVAMADAGLATIQLRAKRLDDRPLGAICEEAFRRLVGWAGALWIDDRADFGRLFPFAGVHLGQHDVPPARARGFLPADRAIGFSTHDEGQLRAADSDPATDWIALGPIFATASKEAPDPVVGLARLAELRGATAKPLVAIGGIDAGNAAAVLAAGADSVAVLAALCRGDLTANCRALLAAIDREGVCACS
jgi:thiamine-phosphate pyrophosphorylase